jgi:hypothetical protein
MSEDPSQKPDLASLGMDLARSFQPSWVNDPPVSKEVSKMAERFDRESPKESRGGRDARSGGNFRPPNRDGRDGRGDKRGGPGGRDRRDGAKGRGGPGKDRSDRRDRKDRNDRPQRPEQPARPAAITGWEVRFLPDPRGIEGLIRQVKTLARAYPLFDLARLILDRAERYSVEFKAQADGELFQYRGDGTLWTTEAAAITHALSTDLAKFYVSERVQIAEPKGSFSFIAECDGVLLGPPNHHDYQSRLRNLHAGKFARIPFEAFKGRVRMLKDEETLQKWKDEQSFREEFTPVNAGENPERLVSMEEVTRHFRSTLASSEILRRTGTFEVSGPAAIRHSATPVTSLVREANDALMKFPLPLAHEIGQAFTGAGLQIFKARDNITYVSVARPRPLDLTQNLADGVRGIMQYLEANPKVPRPEQWKGLLALRPLSEGVDEKLRENAVAADLAWLLHEGHVIDYANRGLEVVKPKPVAQ